MKLLVLAGLLVLSSQLQAQPIDLPSRAPTAKKGSEVARAIRDLSRQEREAVILAEVKSGNVPPFFRVFVPVVVTSGTVELTYEVAADYLAVGSDDDYFLTPLSPESAQKVADWLGCTMPTTKMVDDIYARAAVKLTPEPIPPSTAMTTVPVFWRHQELIRAQRQSAAPGLLVAGHKKDVVIANRGFATPGRVAIYGWHRGNGQPIQPLYAGHTSNWVDYSHGIRLVKRRMMVNGRRLMVEDILKDQQLAPLLNSDGVMTRTRYPVGEGAG